MGAWFERPAGSGQHLSKANALAEPSIPLDFGFVPREILHCHTQKFPDRRIAQLSSKARPPGGFLLFAAWSSDLSAEAVRRGLLRRTRKLNSLPQRPLLRDAEQFAEAPRGYVDSNFLAKVSKKLALALPLPLGIDARIPDANEWSGRHLTLRDHMNKRRVAGGLDRALIAVQGPGAELALVRLASNVSSMRFMDARETNIMGAKCIATRSGYTGEDGFEISIPSSSAREIVETLLAQPNVEPIGLGARDLLRLEAGLCLYDADLDEATTPVEGGLSWAIQKVRRRGGSRAGGFPGADLILNQLDAGAARRRVGLRPEGRAPVRGGALLFADDDGGEPLGRVTSGGFGPTVEAPIAMGYLPAVLSKIGSHVYVELRGKREPTTVVTLPFVKPRYKHD